MNRIVLTVALLGMNTLAFSSPPPGLAEAVAKWAAPAKIAQFDFSLVDLNSDGDVDAVVHVTDPSRCGNGGCPLLVFKHTSQGFEKIGDSGVVSKPIYLLRQVDSGWTSLAAKVGMGDGAGMRPIRFMDTEYRPNPVMRAFMELRSENYQRSLDFERTP
jgi:hypothetical protein